MEPLTIGILYESDEWSDHKLAQELQQALARAGTAASVQLINMELPSATSEALDCSLLVSRVFASAQFRDHHASLEHMEQLIEALPDASIPIINPSAAHAYETDKRRATMALKAAGIDVPTIYDCHTPTQLSPHSFRYPCVIKPNCGGRGELTAILREVDDADRFIADAPDIEFIVEEYIQPEFGFLTRIEIIDGKVGLVVKRSIAENGLSGYHYGSTYEPYPDCSPKLIEEAEHAARTLDLIFGSFDVIECSRGAFFIDANSVSNVSEDCTELLGIDLMKAYAEAIANMIDQPPTT